MKYRLVNLAIAPTGVRYKESSMPFVQMENISHFLRACQNSPLQLQPHDVFQTVDLYEKKDPAQVIQCIGAFSRRANAVKPSAFPRVIGKTKQGAMSPQLTGGSNNGYSATRRGRGTSNASESSNSTYTSPSWGIGGRTSPTKNGTASPTTGLGTWTKKPDTAATGPAWNGGYNLLTSGYMGGASQGNQGITFGTRRQITTPAPKVPSLAEKERRRREQEAEEERLRIAAEEAERERRKEREAEEERARIAEEKRWEEETKRQREKERKEAEEEKRRWEDEERRWKEEEEVRLREEKETETRLEKERQRKRAGSDARLQGQFLSQYQSQQRQLPKSPGNEDPERAAERARMKDLERQLEEAKERERQYERERLERLPIESQENDHGKETVAPPTPLPKSSPSAAPSEDSWQAEEREYLRKQWAHNQSNVTALHSTAGADPPNPPRPLPIPQTQSQSLSSRRPLPPVSAPSPTPSPPLAQPSRPLPNPQTYTPSPSRTENYLSSHPAPIPHTPQTHTPPSAAHTSTSEANAETARRLASQQKTKAGGWASKSLLEREMERERQRQQEWEEGQKQTKEAVARGIKDGGSGPGESWDVNQYGFTGGDSQNRGDGINFGGRRQILGPRPRPS